MFLAYQPYRGPASIPHAPAEFFGAFFLAINVSAPLTHTQPRPSRRGWEEGLTTPAVRAQQLPGCTTRGIAAASWHQPLRAESATPPPHAHNHNHTARTPRPPPRPQTSLLCHMFPGKVFGSELRARKYE